MVGNIGFMQTQHLFVQIAQFDITPTADNAQSKCKEKETMKIFAITWNGNLSKGTLFLHRQDAEVTLKRILEGRTYDQTPRLEEIEVMEEPDKVVGKFWTAISSPISDQIIDKIKEFTDKNSKGNCRLFLTIEVEKPYNEEV